MTQISVNGESQPLAAGATVADLVLTLTTSPEGCAVAINDAVVPKSTWQSRAIESGDRIEVLTAVQGG